MEMARRVDAERSRFKEGILEVVRDCVGHKEFEKEKGKRSKC